jgi:hypothetical protein
MSVHFRIATLVLLLLGALAVAGCGGGGSSGGSGDVDSSAIELPTEIDGYKELVTQIEAQGQSGKTVTDQKQNQETMQKETAAAYSKAYGGAGAAYRAYADKKLEKLPYVIAVRAEAPGATTGPVVDPKFLGLAKPEREVVTVGAVECLIFWSPPVIEGAKPEPESEQASTCQRVGEGATVFVGAVSFSGPSGLKEIAGFTEAAWKSVTEG